jgi:hypothetical protein
MLTLDVIEEDRDDHDHGYPTRDEKYWEAYGQPPISVPDDPGSHCKDH